MTERPDGNGAVAAHKSPPSEDQPPGEKHGHGEKHGKGSHRAVHSRVADEKFNGYTDPD